MEPNTSVPRQIQKLSPIQKLSVELLEPQRSA